MSDKKDDAATAKKKQTQDYGKDKQDSKFAVE
jgi:hypothetical protein